MPKTKISDYSSTANDNSDINSINIAEGCAPSNINDAIREMMAQLKNYQAGLSGDTVSAVGSVIVKGTSATGGDIQLYEDTDNGTNYVAFKAPASISTNVTWTLPSADGSANQVLQTNGSGTLSWTTADVTLSGNNAFTGANTFYNATGQTFAPAIANDGIIVQGRAGGTSNYRVTLATTTLSASRTVTFPDADTRVPIASQAITFSGPSAARTYTFPDASTTVLTTNAAVTVAQGGTGLTSGTSGGVPYFSSTSAIASSGALSANQFVFGGGAGAAPTSSATVSFAAAFTGANTFYNSTGQTFGTGTSTQDGFVIGGRAGGSSSYRITFTPDTLSASRTVTFPDGGGNYTVGYRNLPPVGTKTGSYILATADVGKYVQVSTGGSITIPNATFAEGDAITIFNNTTGNITITCSITTAYIAGTDTDKATMTLATRGVATVLFISSTVCVVSGNVT